jgi:phosphoribosyl 1,2-cyclic phosphodiesterase
MLSFDFPTQSIHLQTTPASQMTVSTASQFTIKFWGVRGNIPTPGIETVRYGGNTACVELQVGGKRLIFDGGTGLRSLSKRMMEQMPVEAHIFFTHTHWDRIQGFPFFMPAFHKGNCFHIYGSTGSNGASIKQRLCDQMLRPHFPVPMRAMQADLEFHIIAPGSVISLDDVLIEAISLNRPSSALGYRVTRNSQSVVYATDTDHSSDAIDPSLLYLAQQADVLIYDAAYADHAYYDQEFTHAFHADRAWHKAMEMAIAAEVKQIIMFHHDPSHDDDFLDQVEQDVQKRFQNVKLAREGMVLSLFEG